VNYKEYLLKHVVPALHRVLLAGACPRAQAPSSARLTDGRVLRGVQALTCPNGMRRI
jgi:hypothetical protein